MEDKELAVLTYRKVKEEILYNLPLQWADVETTERTKRGHCGSKAELLGHKLSSMGYAVRYVIGYRVGILPKFLRPKFLDVHIWVETYIDGSWLTLDPTPDSEVASIVGDTEPGTHQGEPEYTLRVDELTPMFKDVYNSWCTLHYRIIFNIGLAVVRRIVRIKQRRKMGKA